jgi:hypothetical protein
MERTNIQTGHTIQASQRWRAHVNLAERWWRRLIGNSRRDYNLKDRDGFRRLKESVGEEGRVKRQKLNNFIIGSARTEGNANGFIE